MDFWKFMSGVFYEWKFRDDILVERWILGLLYYCLSVLIEFGLVYG